MHTSIPAPGLGALGAGRGGKDSRAGPLAGQAGRRRRRHRGDLQARHLDAGQRSQRDRSCTSGSPTRWAARTARRCSSSSQKSLTGHAKGGAAVFQMMGLCQILRDGVIPPNRSLDCVDDELAGSGHFVWAARDAAAGREVPAQGGPGHQPRASVTCRVWSRWCIRRRSWPRSIPSSGRTTQQRAEARVLAGQRRLASAIAGGRPLYERPARPSVRPRGAGEAAGGRRCCSIRRRGSARTTCTCDRSR